MFHTGNKQFLPDDVKSMPKIAQSDQNIETEFVVYNKWMQQNSKEFNAIWYRRTGDHFTLSLWNKICMIFFFVCIEFIRRPSRSGSRMAILNIFMEYAISETDKKNTMCMCDAQKPSNWGIRYWINIHWEIVEFMNLIEITSYVQRTHTWIQQSISSVLQIRRTKWKKTYLFDSFFFLARSDIELLNLKHVPVTWEDWTSKRKRNEQEKCAFIWNVLFASTAADLTVVDGVRHSYML